LQLQAFANSGLDAAVVVTHRQNPSRSLSAQQHLSRVDASQVVVLTHMEKSIGADVYS
jgi:hypothetical protein